jgi:hypothetical protein
MIDFREEINKYMPVLEMEGVGEAANNEELKDVMDLLQRVTDQLISNAKEQPT